jgi:(p)ppGpp synthase/HD superfamily hydrolase
MDRYQKLTIPLRYYFLGKGFHTALEAFEMGRALHTGTRKDGVTPEFMHQVQICHYLRTIESGLMFPQETFVAALMHDTPEDVAHVMHDDMLRLFGEPIHNAVYLLDKNGKSMEGYFEGLSTDPIASIVKLADRVHNMSTMVNVFTQEKQTEYVWECETYFMPLIKRARRSFPKQEGAYENAKHVLNIQLDLLQVVHGERGYKV